MTTFMIPTLDRKLIRDVWRMRGQAIAIAIVVMCGIASFVTLRGSYEAMLASQASYYEQYRFADVFANVKRAPVTLLERIQEFPGANEVQGRVVFEATLDVPGLDEPASGRLVSLPIQPGKGLNRVHIRYGRLPQAGNLSEVLVSEAFAQANKLQPGHTIGAIINGRKERLHIVGIAISPEFINEISGSSFPDHRRFGVMWMDHEALSSALNMRDSFNDLSLVLAPKASASQVIERLDKLLAVYGSLGAYARDEQLSHNFLTNELNQTRVSGTVIPAIFLGVVAFLIHNILLRITTLQRAQIALLKSFGYSDTSVGLHYVKFALLTVMLGCLVGIGLGTWLGHGLASIHAEFYHFPRLEFSLSLQTVIASVLIACLSAIFGASLAVMRVLRLAPAEAMHPESPARFRPGPLERLGLQRMIPLVVRMMLRGLERKPLKALLSVLGLSLAVSLMVVGQYSFDALDEVIRLQFRTAQRDDLTVRFNEAKNIGIAENLASLPGVLRVEPYRNAPVKIKFRHRSKKTVIIALPHRRELRRILDENENPVALPHDGIVLTKKFSEILGVRIGDTVDVEFMEGKRKTAAVVVNNIIDEPIGTLTYMDINALSGLLEESVTANGAFLSVDPLHQSALYRKLKEVPAISSLNLREATLESFLATVAENMRINTVVLIVFACAITGGIVYNSARIALSEHAIELASLRILGFTKNEVGAILLGEQAILTVLAIPFGCLLGYGLAGLLSVLLSQELFRIPLVVSTETFLSSVLVLLVSAVLAALMVWRQVQQLNMIEVLKTRE